MKGKSSSQQLRASARSESSRGGLSATQTKELRGKLQALYDDIESSIIAKSGLVIQEGEVENINRGDDAEIAEKQRASNAALQELDILKNRLNMVKRALIKLERGVYGYCEETEEPIGYERLSAVPWARFSVQVQERRERKLRDFRVGRLRAEM